MPTYSPEQRQMIQLALRLSSGLPPRVRRSLLAAMAVEANYRNVPYGDRDSEGVLQQRPSQGWGSAAETPAQDIRQYLSRALKANQGFQGTAGQLAQTVQRSAFPERYDERMGEVNAILARLGGAPAGGMGGAAAPMDSSGAAGSPDMRQQLAMALIARSRGGADAPSITDIAGLVRAGRQNGGAAFGVSGDSAPVSGGGFVSPLSTKMPGGSEFGIVDPEGAPGPKGQRYHAGKDWFAPAGAAVRAPVNGRIVEVKASRGNSGQVFGGVVKVQDAKGRVFVFRHVDPRGVKVGQGVQAGSLIATVSPWTGGSAHAHLEIWRSLQGGYNLSNMLDPARFFA